MKKDGSDCHKEWMEEYWHWVEVKHEGPDTNNRDREGLLNV